MLHLCRGAFANPAVRLLLQLLSFLQQSLTLFRLGSFLLVDDSTENAHHEKGETQGRGVVRPDQGVYDHGTDFVHDAQDGKRSRADGSSRAEAKIRDGETHEAAGKDG